MFFDEIDTLAGLKAEFRRLAKEHHPDHGGNPAIMRAIIAEYHHLAKILPDIPATDETDQVAPEPVWQGPRPNFSYRPTTAGGANGHIIRLAKPLYSHEQLCGIARAIWVYADRGQGDVREIYRGLCRLIDQGQTLPYRDYAFSRKIAAKSLKFLKEKVLAQVFVPELWRLARKADAALAA